MKKFFLITAVFFAILLGAFLLVNWNARQNASDMLASLETEAIQRASLSSVVGATGTVRANQSANLAWKVSGFIDEVLVEAGDTVVVGETLGTLAETSLPVRIIMAQADLINYEKELETLLTSPIQQAEAFKAVEEAENALQDAQHPELAQAQALTAVAAAEADLDEAQTQYAILTKSVSQEAIDQAYANMLLAENKLNKTLEEIEKLEWNRTRMGASRIPSKYRKEILKGINKGLEGLEFQRTRDQLAYDRAVAKYEKLLEPPDPLDIAIAEAAVFAAQAQLDDAILQYERIENGYSSADIAVLEAELADARLEYERVKDGPPTEDIAVLEAKIAASQATMDQTKIVAPFSGTITRVDIQPGDKVSHGKVAFRLDDLSTLLVDIDVPEIDINLVKLGQEVVLTFDSILAKEYHGTVIEVAAVGIETQGVTNFRVTVELTDADDDVLPGMTSAVDIITSEVDNVLLVPNRAIRLLEGERVIYVLTKSPEKLADTSDSTTRGLSLLGIGDSPLNAIVPIPVTLGASSDLYSEVLSGNLEEGDLVLLNPPTDELLRSSNRAVTVEINP